jgi:hypothetical protein
VEFSKRLHSSRLQPCLQIVAKGVSDCQVHVAYTLAYYETDLIAAVKSFTVQVSDLTTQWAKINGSVILQNLITEIPIIKSQSVIYK